MDLKKVVQIRCRYKDFIKFPRSEDYSMLYVDKSNSMGLVKDLDQITYYINKELPDWDDAPTITDVFNRFKANSFCLLFYYKKQCIGWNWGNPNFTLDWINTYQELPKGHAYGGGCYVTKLVERPFSAGFINYNMYYEQMLIRYKTCYGYCDDWNKVAIKLNFKMGCHLHDFILEKQK